MTIAGTVLVHAVVTLGMLVVVPLGLRLVDGPEAAAVRRLWWFGAVPGVLALWLPRGLPSALLATAYALLATGAGIAALVRLTRRPWTPANVAVATALGSLPIAAWSLVAERAGYDLLGFDAVTLTLTVAHFHFAGFAAALIAGLLATYPSRRSCSYGPLASAAALSVPAGTGLVFLGYFTGDEMELAGAVVLTAGMWLVGWLTWTELRPTAPDRLTRALFAVSAVVLVITMLLALSWAVGEVFDTPHLSLGWMAATHGVANALGFALCGVLALRRTHALSKGTT